MAENDGRGFASPPDELHDRVGGRIRARLLLHASRGWLTVGLALLAGHVLGTALPLFVLPQVTWDAFPVPTLEGQYVLKNVVLAASAFTVARAHRRARAERVLPSSPI